MLILAQKAGIAHWKKVMNLVVASLMWSSVTECAAQNEVKKMTK